MSSSEFACLVDHKKKNLQDQNKSGTFKYPCFAPLFNLMLPLAGKSISNKQQVETYLKCGFKTASTVQEYPLHFFMVETQEKQVI